MIINPKSKVIHSDRPVESCNTDQLVNKILAAEVMKMKYLSTGYRLCKKCYYKPAALY